MKKENAVERLRRLLNENFEDNEVKITVTYEDCSSYKRRKEKRQ